MGGKKKSRIQPRVKDNLKPSSSDKAAQFLVQQTGGIRLPNEILKLSSAFQSSELVNSPFESGPLSTALGFIPIPQSSHVGDVESGLLRILKRLDKRHSVTKQKALVELTELIKAPPGSGTDVKDCEIATVIPYWPQIFCRLTQDADRQVREHAQRAMAALASRAGRNLAPFIKKILPVWAFATMDSHEPAAAAAKRGLTDTFPGPKRSEANRIYSRQLLDMIEVRLNEALRVTATDTQQFDNGAKTKKKSSAKRTDELKQTQPTDTTNTELPANPEDSNLLHLSATIRFLASLLEDLAGLAPDHSQLSRLKSWLTPDNLWTRISSHLVEHLRGGHARCRRLTCTMSSVHSALYQLSACLCKSASWSGWLSAEGESTARYLCRSTIARLDTSPHPASSTCQLSESADAGRPSVVLIPPPLITCSLACYTKCWKAALVCLTDLPNSLVWSTVDWTADVAPQLLSLILHCDAVYARQIFPNLVGLLIRSPINFNDLSTEEEALIEQIFVQSALKGVERFILPPSANGDRDETAESSGPPSSSSSTEPEACVYVVSGVLACSLYLIDRVLSGTGGKVTGNRELVDRIVDKVVFRLLSDALDAPSPEESDSYTLLVCAQPPIFRQAYLKAVFSETVQLLCYLNACEYQPKASQVYQSLRCRLLSLLVLTDSRCPVTTDEIAYRLGQVDPLRFITFIDHLTSKTIGRPGESAPLPPWVVDLLSEIAGLVEPKACDRTSAVQYLVYLAVYTHLPSNLQKAVPDFSSVVFDLLLPQLPSEVHSVCWLDTVVAGVATAWALSGDTAVVAPPFSEVLSHFMTDLLPALMRYTATGTVRQPCWYHRLACLLENWIQAWADEAFGSGRICDTISHTVNAVFSLSQSTASCLLQATVLRQLDAYLQALLMTDESGLLVPLSDRPFAYVMAAHLISDLLSNVDRVSWSQWSSDDLDCLHREYVTLVKLAFVLYRPPHDFLLKSDGMLLTGASRTVSLAEVIASTAQCLLRFIGKQLTVPAIQGQTELSPFLTTVNDLLFIQVTRTACVTFELVSFSQLLYSELSTVASTKLIGRVAELWLSKLTSAVGNVVDCMANKLFSDSRLDMLPLGHLLELPSMHCLGPLSGLVRLHQFGVFFDLHRQLSRPAGSPSLWNKYLQCLGLLRVWISSLPEPWSLELEFGLPSLLVAPGRSDTTLVNLTGSFDPARSSLERTAHILDSELGRLWCASVSSLPLESLMAVMETPCVFETLPPLKTGRRGQELVTMTLNALWRNRLRSIHFNSWPRSLQLAASCVATLGSGVTWFEVYILNGDKVSGNEMEVRFRLLCELYLPLGVVRRCLPREKLLALVKSVSTVKWAVEEGTRSSAAKEVGANILQAISSLVSVRSVAPVFVTTFVSTVTSDYRDWLTGLTDGLDTEALATLPSSSHVYRALVSVMNYFEVLLLLWQPWQWIVNASDRLQTSSRLGLIQLSLRLRQLRPCLDAAQWDFVMCSLLGWQTIAASYLLSLPEVHSFCPAVTPSLLFTGRAFRVAAAVGAMFTGRQSKLPSLSAFLALAKPGKSAGPAKNRQLANEDEWGDDFDQEVDDDGPNAGKELYPLLDASDDEEPEADGDERKAPLDDKALMEALDRIESAADAENEATDYALDQNEEKTVSDEDVGSGGFVASAIRRGRVPKSIISDWHNFFANHLYSSLLPAVFHTCLILHEDGFATASTPDTSPHIQSLCAAFATCPASELVSVLSDQPSLVLEYLVDLPGMSAAPTGQLLHSVCCSINDLTPGFRAGLDLASRLMATCCHQPGQLLGHILLTRLLSASAQGTGSPGGTVNVSNYLIHRLPAVWLRALHGSLPPALETALHLDLVSQGWGSGQQATAYLTNSNGQQLDPDAHRSVLSYLLAWDCLLSLLTYAGAQARARLQRALLGPSSGLLDRLLLSLGILLPGTASLEVCVTSPCRLEPDERLLLPVSSSQTDLLKASAAALSSTAQQRGRRPMRLATPLASGDDSQWREAFGPDDRLVCLPGHRLASDISHMAVRLLRRFLAEAPALIRSWHRRLAGGGGGGTLSDALEDGRPEPQTCSDSSGGCSSPLANQRTGRLRQLANGIEKLVSRHFSPVIAQDEVLLVQHRAYLRHLSRSDSQKTAIRSIFSLFSKPSEVGVVTVRSRPSSREVIAVYQATEEHTFEMVIQLPTNYPLSPTTVTYDRNLVVNKQDWHIWTMQLSVFINNQNGSILDGIDLWQRNVQKLFQGVEECAICYSIVHHNNFSLPKMRCHTCRKLFHYACMHRWFTTSKNPACPLCRNLFYDITGSSRS